ncbi:sulfurtransferase TusA family protein [Acetobacteraceae bacterium]|nr:sulfurtransferase TusA family protein [Acetobacteraceae bacterium]
MLKVSLSESDSLDLRHLNCPLPFVRLHRAMRKLPKGETLKALVAKGTTSDEMAEWAEKMGYCATLSYKNDTECHFLLKRAS